MLNDLLALSTFEKVARALGFRPMTLLAVEHIVGFRYYPMGYVIYGPEGDPLGAPCFVRVVHTIPAPDVNNS